MSRLIPLTQVNILCNGDNSTPTQKSTYPHFTETNIARVFCRPDLCVFFSGNMGISRLGITRLKKSRVIPRLTQRILGFFPETGDNSTTFFPVKWDKSTQKSSYPQFTDTHTHTHTNTHTHTHTYGFAVRENTGEYKRALTGYYMELPEITEIYGEPLGGSTHGRKKLKLNCHFQQRGILLWL